MRTIEGDDDSYDVIDKRTHKNWCNENGQFHRSGDLPAIIYVDGTNFYYKNGKLHRSRGFPAVMFANGIMGYWIDGVQQK